MTLYDIFREKMLPGMLELVGISYVVRGIVNEDLTCTLMGCGAYVLAKSVKDIANLSASDEIKKIQREQRKEELIDLLTCDSVKKLQKNQRK